MVEVTRLAVANFAYNCECPHCTSGLRAKAEDLKYHPSSQDGAHYSNAHYTFECPVCEWVITVPIDDIPKATRALLERKFRNG